MRAKYNIKESAIGKRNKGKFPLFGLKAFIKH